MRLAPVSLMLLTLVPGWIVACAAIAGPTGQDDGSVPTGIWGGEHIRLDVTASGGRVEYDCAQGMIAERMALDRDGRFNARGTHVARRPGPEREGDQPPAVAVRYVGQVVRDSMTLTVFLTETNETVGRFTLTRGRSGVLRRCL